jgi:hypothetical protein
MTHTPQERSAKEREERNETQRQERTRQYRQLMCGVSLAGRGIV